ncbi:MAG: NTP/NDP exchange transporter [Candidatus Binatia bacterium]
MVDQTLAFFKITPGEGFRVTVIAALLFLLIAANNLIKILRDSIFLGHHSVSELPYLYILVALCAGVIIATYARYTVHLSMVRLILATNGVIVFAVAGFWFLLTYINPGWSHYAFYIWSAMATVIAVAQLWTLAGPLFTPDEGKRLFGLVAAGGTLGGVAAGFGAKWTLHLSADSNHLLWVVVGLYLAASLLLCMTQRRLRTSAPTQEFVSPNSADAVSGDNIFAHLGGSPYLKTIAAVILVSVVVSTLIDFELKTAAKDNYLSKSALAGFFSAYYGWLSVATLFAQVVLTGKAIKKLGLNSSLYLTPVVLMGGSLAIMIWPGLLAAVLTRIADTALRNSVHRSSLEVVYMGVPASVKKALKTFLDVVVERVGDAAAGFIILFFSLASVVSYKAYVHFICVGLIFVWMGLIQFLRAGYSDAIHKGLLPDEVSPGNHVSLKMGVGRED